MARYTGVYIVRWLEWRRQLQVALCIHTPAVFSFSRRSRYQRKLCFVSSFAPETGTVSGGIGGFVAVGHVFVANSLTPAIPPQKLCQLLPVRFTRPCESFTISRNCNFYRVLLSRYLSRTRLRACGIMRLQASVAAFLLRQAIMVETLAKLFVPSAAALLKTVEFYRGVGGGSGGSVPLCNLYNFCATHRARCGFSARTPRLSKAGPVS